MAESLSRVEQPTQAERIKLALTELNQTLATVRSSSLANDGYAAVAELERALREAEQERDEAEAAHGHFLDVATRLEHETVPALEARLRVAHQEMRETADDLLVPSAHTAKNARCRLLAALGSVGVGAEHDENCWIACPHPVPPGVGVEKETKE